QLITEFDKRNYTPPLAVLGLGTGTMAGYAKPNQELDYYEIDPAVIKIALNTQYFTFVTDARDRGAVVNIILGDGRLQMARALDQRYGLILLDAFSSDAIPVHLMTREAVQMYLQKLRPDGIIAFHISNRYLKLEGVVANLAKDAGLVAMRRYHNSD